ncbi:MAG TPA: RNA-binding S4 domain-containing protein [Bacteroidia bacterium]|jgi:ribosome-associated heat shock protein Hsp15|nr:RNA-binding S4 domain-containing protein [Bacteroidia bacterium]
MTTSKTEIRLDTYLWAIRVFKSRSLASETIKGGKVKMNESNVKASHIVKMGETYTISVSANHKKTIEVAGLIDKRGNATTAKKYYIDHSPPMEKQDKQEKAFFTMNLQKEKGSGRPTKKDRRNLKKDGGWF